MHDNDRFYGIHDFVAAVRLGSFAAAAASRGVTASGVGKSVSRLESRLGTKLLHRTTRRLALTQEGTAYYDMCVQMLDDLEEMESSLATGRQSQHPRLNLAVTFTDRTVNLVDERVDLAVRIGALNNDADLVARRLGTQRLLICAAPSYLARHGAPLRREQLAEHDCIVGWRKQGPPTWLLRTADGGAIAQPIRVRHEFRDGQAMLGAVLAGAGLCQLPTWLIDTHLRSGAMVPVLDDYAGGEMPIHAVWPVTRDLKPNCAPPSTR